MDEAIQFLLTLQSYDMRLHELMQNLSNISPNIAALDADIDQLNQKMIQKKISIQNVKLEIQKWEKDLKSLEEIIVANKYKLAVIKNLKEYEILAKKIKEEECKTAQLEELLLNRMFEIDSMQLEFSNLQQTVDGEIQRLQDAKEKQRQFADNLKENIAELSHKIVGIRGIIQSNHAHWLRHYDGTKKAVRKMPCIVYVKNYCCGGCNLKLSGSISALDPAFPFVICESCARMILLTPKEENDFNEIHQKITKYN
jgi:predicted  nucleic acid-binding Zn-ribbon protein